MSKNGFKGERTVELHYLKKGDQWRLVKKFVDSEVKRIIGTKAFRTPRTIDSPFIPGEFLPKLYAVLARHHLEAGKIGAFYGPSRNSPEDMMDSYRVEITIRERRVKPSE